MPAAPSATLTFQNSGMKSSYLSAVVLLALATACSTPDATDAPAETPETAFAKTATANANATEAPLLNAFDTAPAPGANYGAGVAADANPMAYADFVQLVATHDTVRTAVAGTVVEVCQKKGCWMTLQPTGANADANAVTDAAEPYMVRFKDYGFFMPKTLSGHEVVVEGVARVAVTPVDELRHYAEDAGQSAEEVAAIAEPREEVSFEATGVRVL